MLVMLDQMRARVAEFEGNANKMMSDSDPSILGVFELFDGRNGERRRRRIPRELFHRYRRIRNAKQVERVYFASFSRRGRRAGLYDEGRVAVNVVALRVAR